MVFPVSESKALYRPFAAFHSLGTKPPCWDAKVALGQDQHEAYIILNGNFICLSCPSATFVSQHGGFVPREWKAAKVLLAMLKPLTTWQSTQSWH